MQEINKNQLTQVSGGDIAIIINPDIDLDASKLIDTPGKKPKDPKDPVIPKPPKPPMFEM